MAHKTHAGFTCLVPEEGYDFYCGISGDLVITFIIVHGQVEHLFNKHSTQKTINIWNQYVSGCKTYHKKCLYYVTNKC